jgi:hypothetical protein
VLECGHRAYHPAFEWSANSGNCRWNRIGRNFGTDTVVGFAEKIICFSPIISFWGTEVGFRVPEGQEETEVVAMKNV